MKQHGDNSTGKWALSDYGAFHCVCPEPTLDALGACTACGKKPDALLRSE